MWIRTGKMAFATLLLALAGLAPEGFGDDIGNGTRGNGLLVQVKTDKLVTELTDAASSFVPVRVSLVLQNLSDQRHVLGSRKEFGFRLQKVLSDRIQ